MIFGGYHPEASKLVGQMKKNGTCTVVFVSPEGELVQFGGPCGRGNSLDLTFKALSEKLTEIKEGYPTKTDASILLESDIAYDTLVQVMDRVRIAERIEEDEIVRFDLFPDISIGDAPILQGGA